MGQLIPFTENKLPAHLAAFHVTNTDLTANVGASFPFLSIKGKVFTLVRNNERTLITKPDDPDEPATSLEVVMLRANPALSKIYYASAYVEGSDDKPDCFSNDGVNPDPSVDKPVAKVCAACPNNVWGSKISEDGKKLKACSDARRLAVAPAGALNDPMLIRTPPASLSGMAEYGAALDKRGVPYHAVVTKIGFDHTVASPKLTFKAVAFLSEEQFKEVQKLRDSDLVAQIIGMGAAKPATEPEKEPETKQEAKQEPEQKQENAPRRGRPPGSTNKPKDEPEQKAKEPETKPEPAPEKPKNTAASAFSMMSADLEREMAEALAQTDD